MPAWLSSALSPWTTPAALFGAVVAVAALVGVRGRRLATLAAVVAAGLGLWQAWKIGPPSGLLDLKIYVHSARGWLEGGSLYDYSDPVFHLSATYPPIGPLLFSVLSPLTMEAREVLWTAVSLASLAGCAGCAAVLAGVAPERRRTWALWAFALAVTTIPAWLTLRLGQVNVVLWLLVLGDLVALTRRSRWAGVGIGLATSVKLVPGLFLVWLAVAGVHVVRRGPGPARRRLRLDHFGVAAVRGVATAAAVTIAGWAVAPDDSWRYWTGLMWDSHRVGLVDDDRNNSLLRVVADVVSPGQARTATWLLLAAVVVVVALVRGRGAARRGDLLAVAVVVGCASSLISPISWTHHLGFLVLALAALSTVEAWWRWPAVAAGWLFLVDPGGLGDHPTTATIRVFVMIALVVAMPVVDGRTTGSASDGAEEPLDELPATAVDVVAADRHAPDDLGAPLAHDVGELVEGLPGVEGVGAEHRASLPRHER
ncbi:MAG TPA: glycosyltransferase 87 family protein [Acidimicrobiales bacterium]